MALAVAASSSSVAAAAAGAKSAARSVASGEERRPAAAGATFAAAQGRRQRKGCPAGAVSSSSHFAGGDAGHVLRQVVEGCCSTSGRPSGSSRDPSRRRGCARRGPWRMEVEADPLENYRDSFGNECTVERRFRKELETNDAYRTVTSALVDVRHRMNGLVAEELYEEAAQVLDTLNMLEFRKRLLELSAKPRVLYRVGDVIVHRRYGYRGVVYGHDPQCSAPPAWQDAMKIQLLPEGHRQPFYHVLVDIRDRPGGMSTYVAQENMAVHKLGRPVLHPWIGKFFVGFQDGTYVPGPKLRQVYPNDW